MVLGNTLTKDYTLNDMDVIVSVQIIDFSYTKRAVKLLLEDRCVIVGRGRKNREGPKWFRLYFWISFVCCLFYTTVLLTC